MVIKRLKLINILIVFIAVVFIGMFLMYKEIYIKFNPLIEEYNMAKETYESMSLNTLMKDEILNRNKELINDFNNINIDKFLLQEDIMVFIYTLSKVNNVTIEEFVFSEQSYVANSGDEEGFASIDKSNLDTLIINNVNIKFKCSFNDMLKFIDDIKNDNKYVAISSFNLLSWNENVVYCQVDLCFYTIPIMAKGDYNEKQ